MHSVQEVPLGFDHPDITFTKDDFRGIKPHKDDPIVVHLRVNNYDIRRVLLDQGSLVDLIYGDAFDKLGLKDNNLQSYTRSLVGFTGDRRGYLELDTNFGKGESVKKLRMRYLVLQCVASYNVIIFRNT